MVARRGAEPSIGDQPRPVAEHTEERRRVDVAIAAAEPEEEPVRGAADDLAGHDTGADGPERDGQAAVGRRASVDLVDDEVAHAGDDAAEGDRAGCRGDDYARPAAGWYSKPRLPGQKAHAGARNGSTTGAVIGG